MSINLIELVEELDPGVVSELTTKVGSNIFYDARIVLVDDQPPT